MANNNNFKSPYRENITDERVLNLGAMNEAKKRANYNVRYAGNKIRLTVWTGIDNDVENGKITATIPLNVYFCFLELLEATLHNHEKHAKAMVIKELGKNGWKDGPKDRGELWCGRNDEGVVFIAFVQPNRPKITFPLVEDAFYLFKNKDGSPLSKSEASDIVTKGYLKLSREVLSTLSATEFVPKDERPNQNRGGNRQQQSSQNQNNDFGNTSSNNSPEIDTSSTSDDSFDF